jgi:UDP-N-acetylmuramyl pentapeptide phosphotransferase/UDP-N-acetylglucosamine-1-phosphate transferase
MLYYLATHFTAQAGVLNIFSYHTVRAGGALVTGFLFCLVVGPKLIELLRTLKVGQHIKEEHVKDLHALHKSKAGTPTMGGLLIVVSTLLSLLIWSTLTNRLLLAAVAVMCLMAAVGFLDDYIKLKRKHNDGLSAKAKLLGQLLAGGLLGLYVVMNPITYGASYFTAADVLDWDQLSTEILAAERAPFTMLSEYVRPEVKDRLAFGDPNLFTRELALADLNRALDEAAFFETKAPDPVNPDPASASLDGRERVRLNRMALEMTAPDVFAKSLRRPHTKVGVPGFKDLMIPLGFLYIPFVILIMVGSTNAVNLTDGLDGLAAGTSVISIGAFTGIAYVVSRADWSNYLFVMHVPEASELTVFGSAILGSGLGFLWFNTHPADIFMGDTGSLALGGVIASMAILTKQELILPIVGGLFVLEALSVIIQVVSFKTRGKRVFLMAPLHHHFELKGWSETKVTIRFWIVAIMFALLSLSTLKLR